MEKFSTPTRMGGGGGGAGGCRVGGGLPYKNYGGARRKLFEKHPKKYRNLVCVAWLNWVFTLRGTNSKTTHVIICHAFCLNALKGTAIFLTVVILDFITPSGTNFQIFTPKHPCQFHLEPSPPPPPPRGNRHDLV